MKRVLIVVVMVCAVLALAGSRSYASCGGSTPIANLFDGFLNCDDDPTHGSVAAYVYELDNPNVINSGPVACACRFTGDPTNPSCIGVGSGSPSTQPDGHVTIETDALIAGWNGCPIDAANVPHRIIATFVDASGNGAILSISGGAGYSIEFAGGFDPVANAIVNNITCSPASGRPRVVSAQCLPGPGCTNATSVVLGLSFSKPTQIYNDCDSSSFGSAAGSCTDAFVPPAVNSGPIFTIQSLCNQRPDTSLARWTNTATTPDATGRATLSLALPLATGNCWFVGGTAQLGTNPVGLSGFVQVSGNPALAASPKAENVSAKLSNGKVNITWTSSTELGLAAYKVLTVAKGSKGQLELATLSPNGNGGGSHYSVSLGLGDFKGGRMAIVRAVMTDGTTIDAAPVNF